MAKIYTSSKNIIQIGEFMHNYLNININCDKKITHYILNDYLEERGMKRPIKIPFKNVRKQDIVSGEYLIVNDENNQKVIYKNPMYNLDSLQRELSSDNHLELTEKRRRVMIEKLGLNKEDDYKIEKENRYNKQYTKRRF